MMAVIIGTYESRVRIGAATGISSIVVFDDFTGGFRFFLFGAEFLLKVSDSLFKILVLMSEECDFLLLLR